MRFAAVASRRLLQGLDPPLQEPDPFPPEQFPFCPDKIGLSADENGLLRLRRAEIANSTPHVDWIEFVTFGAYNYDTPADYFTAINSMDTKRELSALKELVKNLKSLGLPINDAHAEVDDQDTDMTEATQSETHDTFNTRTIKEAQINDGTVRITVILKPDDFTAWKIPDAWHTVNAFLKDLLDQHPDTVKLYPWRDETSLPIIDSAFLHNDPEYSLEPYLAAPVLSVAEKSTFIAVFRASVPMSASALLRPVKDEMDASGMTLRISNSTSAGGDIVYAGDLFFKHPTHTHRFHYLKFLRSILPSHTPHFDLTTSPGRNGEPSRLKIMCGKNHLSALSDILTTHLNGKQTTEFFLSHILAKTTSQREIDNIHKKQKHFLDSSAIIPVPMLTNLDLVRTEKFSNGKTAQRTLRMWARQLKDQRGKTLHCDADKGKGKVVIVCPTEYKVAVENALQQYQDRLRQANGNTLYDNLPIPTDIFLKDMASESTPNPWFPASRSTTSAPSPNFRSQQDFPPLPTRRVSPSAPSPPTATPTVESSVTFSSKIQELEQAHQRSLKDLQTQIDSLKVQLETTLKDQEVKTADRIEQHLKEVNNNFAAQQATMQQVLLQLQQLTTNQSILFASAQESPVHKRQRSPLAPEPPCPPTQLFPLSQDATPLGQNTLQPERDGQSPL
jgi:hypothetical protein